MENKVYQVFISRKAEKFIEKLSEPHYTAIKKAVLNLATNCRPAGYKKLKGLEAYRIRVGNYRIIYEIKDNILTIEVVAIGHRKDIYNQKK